MLRVIFREESFVQSHLIHQLNTDTQAPEIDDYLGRKIETHVHYQPNIFVRQRFHPYTHKNLYAVSSYFPSDLPKVTSCAQEKCASQSALLDAVCERKDQLLSRSNGRQIQTPAYNFYAFVSRQSGAPAVVGSAWKMPPPPKRQNPPKPQNIS